MTTVDRYLLRELLTPLAVGLGLFFVVVAFAQVLTVSDAVTGLGITGADILQALLYSLPPLMGVLLPVSVLFATLLAVGRLASDREILGMAAGGLSPYRLLAVPLAVGAVVGLASCLALVYGEPWGVRGLRQLMSRSAQKALASGVRTGEFLEWLPGVTFLAQSREGDELRDVMLADRRDPDRAMLISAARGFVQSGEKARDIVFTLYDGSIVATDRESAATRVIDFGVSHYRLDVQQLVRNKAKTLPAAQAKSLRALWRDIQRSTKPRERGQLIVTLNRKFALPLATLIFAALAVPLASRSAGGARARGFLYGAGLIAAYYYVGRTAEIVARGGDLNPWLAAWLPNLLAAAGMVVLLARLRRSAV